jgi:AcrR family transcriptional regulator
VEVNTVLGERRGAGVDREPRELGERSESRESGAARDKLLAAVIGYVAAHGFSGLSLRELAAAIGTSHRMLIYHFGSREGLLVAVVRAVEAAQREFLAELAADTSLSPAEVMRTMWRRVADPSLWPNERLFFEIYAQALQHRPGTAGFLDDIVGSWVEPMAEYARQRGLDPDAARTDARLAVAVSRGLLLDLLATGDRAAVDACVERYLAQYEALNEAASASAGHAPARQGRRAPRPPTRKAARTRAETASPGGVR